MQLLGHCDLGFYRRTSIDNGDDCTSTQVCWIQNWIDTSSVAPFVNGATELYTSRGLDVQYAVYGATILEVSG